MAGRLPAPLAGNQPVEPQVANGAQIPLDDFNIPQFPREAGGLMALTLTSAISVDKYSEVLEQPFTVTHLPPSIQSLTLELFAFGYPPGFLKALIAELPELRSLVVYSQLFTGTSSETLEDAINFVQGAKKLRALHLLDAFVAPSFLKGIAPSLKKLEKPLMFIEINYTYRAENKGFMDRVPAAELPLLIHPGLISCSFNISSPEISNDVSQTSQTDQDGIRMLDNKHSEVLVQTLLHEDTAPQVIKHLNITLYPISPSQLRQVVTEHKGLMVLNVSVQLGNDSKWKTHVFSALAAAENLEQVEIVLCPVAGAPDPEIMIEEQRLVVLGGICKKLASFKVNQLRRQISKTSVDCSMAGGKWKIDLKEVKEVTRLTGVQAGNPKAVSSTLSSRK
jgi:hypothetical protein